MTCVHGTGNHSHAWAIPALLYSRVDNTEKERTIKVCRWWLLTYWKWRGEVNNIIEGPGCMRIEGGGGECGWGGWGKVDSGGRRIR